MLMPSLVLAENGAGEPEHSGSPTPRVTRTPEADHPKVAPVAFCSKFTDATGQVSGDTTSRFNELQANFAKRGDKINTEFKGLSQKITDNRGDWDKKRADNFAKLEAKATTTEQKAAVTTFEAAIKDAVTKRRAAVDAADTTFHNGLLSAVTARQAQLKSAAATYQAAVAAALAAAKASCAAGTSPDTVRKNLQTALQAAHAKLETARASADKVGPNLDTLKAARKAAVEKANADYKAAIQSALATFKAALKAAHPSSSPEPSPSTTP
jgi:hypothetical protein